jgi:hypothetical protein
MRKSIENGNSRRGVTRRAVLTAAAGAAGAVIVAKATPPKAIMNITRSLHLIFEGR